MSKKSSSTIKHIELDKITDPSFLKSLSYEELDVLASDIRKNIIEAVSLNGGHLSSNLGVVELVIALHRSFDFIHDKLIFDVGHQCYTHKILTGRSLKNLRTPSGVSGFQKMAESAYDCYEAGHSSTSISAADGFAVARDLDGSKFDIVALIGDSSLMNGLAFEGLNCIAQGHRKVIIVLNDNGMSIGKTVGGLGRFFSKISTSVAYRSSKSAYQRLMYRTRVGQKIYSMNYRMKNSIKRILVPTTIFDNLGYTYIGPINGNDIKEVMKAIVRAKRASKPVVIHARTKKGLGYTPAQNDSQGVWHGPSPYYIETGLPKNCHDGEKSWSQIYSEYVYAAMESNVNNIVISPATSVGSCLTKVFSDFPLRALDVGIGEEHALTLSSGLALSGKHPIISIYSTFLQRAFDELSHDIARMKLDITILTERAGLVGADGETHQGIFDEAFVINTPNTCVAMASNTCESEDLFNESLNPGHGVFSIRLPREFIKICEKPTDKYRGFGKWIPLKESTNKKVAVISFGAIINKIRERINEENLDVTLVNALYQKPLDTEWVDKLLDYDALIIHDAYAIKGGFVSYLIDALVNKQYKGRIVGLAIPTEFITCDSISNQMKKSKVDVDTVINSIKELL